MIKWNWGTGIVVAFILFCSFVLYIVFRAFGLHVDLVSDTYYLDELAYQDRIEERANLARSGLEIGVAQSEADVVLEFPEAFATASGEIHFYHPSRELFDQRYSIDLDAKNVQKIPKTALMKGKYKVKVQWTVEGVPYFQETEVFLR